MKCFTRETLKICLQRTGIPRASCFWSRKARENKLSWWWEAQGLLPRLFRGGWREKKEYRMQIAVNCKWPSAMKIMEQYLLVLYRDTILLQTRGFFNSNLGRVRIVLPDQPVLPDWELFLAKLTLLWKDDQFGDHKLCQFDGFAFHLLAGIDPTDHSSDKSYRSSFAMTKIIKNGSF